MMVTIIISNIKKFRNFTDLMSFHNQQPKVQSNIINYFNKRK